MKPLEFALPTDLPRQYRYRYTAGLFVGTWRHMFIAIGAHGAVHFHTACHHYDNKDNWSSGLEFHWRVPPPGMQNQPPSHDQCEILKCPCWHDGTSLYADEHYLPMFIRGDAGAIFRSLASDADERLTPKIANEPAS